MKTTLNGIRTTRTERTIFIPLPRELWREIDGGCRCPHCHKHGGISYWDTLAVAADSAGKDRNWDHTWTVHYPELHT